MKKIIRLTEFDLTKLIKRIINEAKYSVEEDDFGNHMVYKKGDYKILVDEKESPKHITLWHEDNGKWKKVGALTVSVSERRFDSDSKYNPSNEFNKKYQSVYFIIKRGKNEDEFLAEIEMEDINKPKMK